MYTHIDIQSNSFARALASFYLQNAETVQTTVDFSPYLSVLPAKGDFKNSHVFSGKMKVNDILKDICISQGVGSKHLVSCVEQGQAKAVLIAITPGRNVDALFAAIGNPTIRVPDSFVVSIWKELASGLGTFCAKYEAQEQETPDNGEKSEPSARTNHPSTSILHNIVNLPKMKVKRMAAEDENSDESQASKRLRASGATMKANISAPVMQKQTTAVNRVSGMAPLARTVSTSNIQVPIMESGIASSKPSVAGSSTTFEGKVRRVQIPAHLLRTVSPSSSKPTRSTIRPRIGRSGSSRRHGMYIDSAVSIPSLAPTSTSPSNATQAAAPEGSTEMHSESVGGGSAHVFVSPASVTSSLVQDGGRTASPILPAKASTSGTSTIQDTSCQTSESISNAFSAQSPASSMQDGVAVQDESARTVDSIKPMSSLDPSHQSSAPTSASTPAAVPPAPLGPASDVPATPHSLGATSVPQVPIMLFFVPMPASAMPSAPTVLNAISGAGINPVNSSIIAAARDALSAMLLPQSQGV